MASNIPEPVRYGDACATCHHDQRLHGISGAGYDPCPCCERLARLP